MADWTSEYLTLIEDCEERCERLTSWEANFIDSIKDQLAEDRGLSPRQVETLESIWEKATKRG